MLWAVLSDVHGNVPALEAVLADMADYDVRGILALGDFVGECPEPVRVLELLEERGAVMIAGNREIALERYGRGLLPQWDGIDQFKPMLWSRERLKGKWLAKLVPLPEERILECDGKQLLLVHGMPDNPSGLVYPEEVERIEGMLAGIRQDVLCCGHCHMRWQHTVRGRFGVNPGAVGLPHDHLPCTASYALVDFAASQAMMRSVPYDGEKLAARFRDTGMLEQGGMLARFALAEVMTGEKHVLWFVNYAYKRKAELTGSRPGPVPDEIWFMAAKEYAAQNHIAI